MNDNRELMMDLANDLSKKSFEELIYIYYNQESYVSNYTEEGRNLNQNLLMEVKKLNEQYENKRMKYNNLKREAEQLLSKFENKEQEIKSGLLLNMNMNNSYNLDNLIKDLENHIQTKLKAPKDQLIKEYMNKSINQKEFEEQFKKISSEYHYYSIILDNLLQLKRLQ